MNVAVTLFELILYSKKRENVFSCEKDIDILVFLNLCKQKKLKIDDQEAKSSHPN